MSRKNNSDENNPCYKEQDLSYKCLGKNNFDREKCEVYFANYNNCKEFWNKIRLDRRRKGLEPFLPNVDERAKIKADYMKTKIVSEE